MPASVLLMPEAVKAVQLYEQGYGTPSIAQALGRSRKAVRTGLRHMGVPARTSTEGLHAWLALREAALPPPPEPVKPYWPFPVKPIEPTQEQK